MTNVTAARPETEAVPAAPLSRLERWAVLEAAMDILKDADEHQLTAVLMAVQFEHGARILADRRNPWVWSRDLVFAGELDLIWAELDPGYGRIERHPNRYRSAYRHRIFLGIKPGRTWAQYSGTLAHELTHLETGILFAPGTPDEEWQAGEAEVERLTRELLAELAESDTRTPHLWTAR